MRGSDALSSMSLQASTSQRSSPAAAMFRPVFGKTARVFRQGRYCLGMSGAWCAAALPMVGVETATGIFRATGIKDCLTNVGRIEIARRLAGHSNAKTIGLYDRRYDDISVGEVERIGT